MNISHKVIAIASAGLIAVSAAGGAALAKGPFKFLGGLGVLEPGISATVACVDKAGDHFLDGVKASTHIQPTSYGGHTAQAIVVQCP
jgi:hypothetical protein